MTAQPKSCTRCKHFRPPEDPKYNKVPEIGGCPDAYNYGQGYMDNSRCAAITIKSDDAEEVLTPIRAARAQGSECGPNAELFEEKPVAPFLEAIITVITDACKPKI